MSYLTVTGQRAKIAGYWRVLCVCQCGNQKYIRPDRIKSGSVVSCGCRMRVSNKKHGMYKTPTWYSWASMIGRTSEFGLKICPQYRNRPVCDRWKRDFSAFFEDMGERPPGTTIERIDNNAGYFPGNCRWATMREQSNNTMGNLRLCVNGRTMTAAQWADETGIPYSTILYRISKGWPNDSVVGLPKGTTSASVFRLERECLKCRYKWFPRKDHRSPCCPNCKSEIWDREQGWKGKTDAKPAMKAEKRNQCQGAN